MRRWLLKVPLGSDIPARAMLERGIPLGPATAKRQPHGV